MFGKWHQKRAQDVCLLSETNSAGDERLDAGVTHAESPETCEAWGLDSKQQCKDEKTGRRLQFVSSLSCDPIKIYRDSEVRLTDTALISSQQEDQELVYIDEGRNHDGRMLWIGICLALLTLTVCIMGLLKLKGAF